jgi:exoribonuclease II
VLVEAVVDPFEPPMPPKVSLKQATKLAKSLMRGPAVVQNHAQLTYNAVAAWLEGQQDSSKGGSREAKKLRDSPGSDISARVLEKIIHDDELVDQLKLQNEVAEQLRERRHQAGALSLETTELQPILSREGHVVDLDARRPNRATLVIEDLMIERIKWPLHF